MQTKTLSIITPVFNDYEGLRRVCQSLETQSSNDFEHIIVDGSDNNYRLNNSVLDNITNQKLIQEPDKGIYDALNKGTSVADGQWIMVLHCNDALSTPKSIENIISELQRVECDVLFCKVRMKVRALGGFFERIYSASRMTNLGLRIGVFPPHTGMVVKNTFANSVGPYSLEFKCASDVDFMIRCFTKSKACISYCTLVAVNMAPPDTSRISYFNQALKSSELYKILSNNRLQSRRWLLSLRYLHRISQFRIQPNCREG